jgi:hypothetical protein
MSDPSKEQYVFVSPMGAKQSVLEVFFTWLIEQPTLPPNYKEVARDFYFLIRLLDKEKAQDDTQNHK